MESEQANKRIYIHVGAGLIAPQTWVNLDASWNARLAKYPRLRGLLVGTGVIPKATGEIPWPQNILIHDIRKGLPFAPGSAQAVYASHLIEHLTQDDARFFVRESHRVLMPGGRIRLVTPDLEYLAAAYLQAKRDNSKLGGEPAAKFLTDLGVLQNLAGTSTMTKLYRLWKSYELHKWLYDEASLKLLLCEVGFVEAGRRGHLESEISNIQDVEHEDRLRGAVCVEAKKP